MPFSVVLFKRLSYWASSWVFYLRLIRVSNCLDIQRGWIFITPSFSCWVYLRFISTFDFWKSLFCFFKVKSIVQQVTHMCFTFLYFCLFECRAQFWAQHLDWLSQERCIVKTDSWFKMSNEQSKYQYQKIIYILSNKISI